MKIRKRCLRLKLVSDSPMSKTKQLEGGIPVSKYMRNTLIVHHALVDNIKKTYASTKRIVNRNTIAGLVSGRILKKYRLKQRLEEILPNPRKHLKATPSNRLRYRSVCGWET